MLLSRRSLCSLRNWCSFSRWIMFYVQLHNFDDRGNSGEQFHHQNCTTKRGRWNFFHAIKISEGSSNTYFGATQLTDKSCWVGRPSEIDKSKLWRYINTNTKLSCWNTWDRLMGNSNLGCSPSRHVRIGWLYPFLCWQDICLKKVNINWPYTQRSCEGTCSCL